MKGNTNEKQYPLMLTKEQHKDLRVTAAQLDMSIKDLLLYGVEKVKQDELQPSNKEEKEDDQC